MLAALPSRTEAREYAAQPGQVNVHRSGALPPRAPARCRSPSGSAMGDDPMDEYHPGARPATRSARRAVLRRCQFAPAARHRRVDTLRRRLAGGSLVPDPARIARALLARGLP
jgi:hypothetical protein